MFITVSLPLYPLRSQFLQWVEGGREIKTALHAAPSPSRTALSPPWEALCSTASVEKRRVTSYPQMGPRPLLISTCRWEGFQRSLDAGKPACTLQQRREAIIRNSISDKHTKEDKRSQAADFRWKCLKASERVATVLFRDCQCMAWIF